MKGIQDAIVLIGALVLQASLLPRLAIAGIQPDLLVAFVVYFGWMRGPIAGALGGFSIGLFQDLDAPGPLGLNALAKTVVGFLVAKAGFRVHRTNVGVRFAFFFLALIAHDLLYFGITTAQEPLELIRGILFVAVPSALYTAALVLGLLAIAERVHRRPLLADEG